MRLRLERSRGRCPSPGADSSPAARRLPAPVRALEWVGGPEGHLRLLDQTLLPRRVHHLRLRDAKGVARAVRRLAVRGAPAIGIAAAYGLVLGLRASRAHTRPAFLRDLERVRRRLAASRPTAVNLFWALERMARAARELPFEALGPEGARQRLLAEALAIHREDEVLCRRIGENGARLLQSGWGVLTHCNAGALATGGAGTALAVIYEAVRQGKEIAVWADETRPLLQGARLTAWELREAGVDVTVICDGAAASLMLQGRIQCAIVGADRIARGGDVANKIGTYAVARLARAHGIPFYVAAPWTTFDPEAPGGDAIPIEERSPAEVTACSGRAVVPRGVRVHNPAFDVTPARYVTAFITDGGILYPPYRRSIARLLAHAGSGARGGGTEERPAALTGRRLGPAGCPPREG